MRSETPQKSINRIINYMGYGNYIEKNGLGNSKIFILKAIAGREKTMNGFITRLEELKEIIQNRTGT